MALSQNPQPLVYEEVVDLLAAADPERIIAYQPSAAACLRVSELLEKNRQGTLTADELAELDQFGHIEHLLRMVKARAAIPRPVTTPIPAHLGRLVRLRAGGRCEYYLLHEQDTICIPFEVVLADARVVHPIAQRLVAHERGGADGFIERQILLRFTLEFGFQHEHGVISLTMGLRVENK